MIDDFIQKEIEYFSPMLERQRLATDEMREAWRQETVAQRIERISLETYEMCDGEVQYGPFRGLKLNKETWWGKPDLGSQCLGLYEAEILQFLTDAGVDKYRTFIDIGAADGYYAIGMLVSGLVDRVVCFEVSEAGREAIEQNWRANDCVGSLQVFGEANSKSLSEVAQKDLENALVLVDIEGYEFELLNLDVIKQLKHCDVLIEIHNWVEDFESKYSTLLKELSSYFNIDVINRIERKTTDFEELRSYTDDNRLLLVSERRPCLMRFLHLTPLQPD